MDEYKNSARYRLLREMRWDKDNLAVVRDPKVAVKLGHDCPNSERLDELLDAELERRGQVVEDTHFQDKIYQTLSELSLRLEGYEKQQPGYMYREGWNQALRRVIDVFRATELLMGAPKPAEANMLRGIRLLMGYVENGTSETVSLGQDDATKSFFVRVGKRHYHSSSFSGALEEAMKDLDYKEL